MAENIEKKMLKDMFDMQQKLNDETNGKGWVIGYTKDNKIINWKRCIYVESVELIESFPWKHWKDISKEPDWENVQIELVDIWHFILSLAIEQSFYKRESIDKMVENITELSNFYDFTKDPYPIEESNSMYILNQIEYIIHKASGNEKDLLDDILDEFFMLCLNCGVNLEILYQRYISKNILNKFRQDNGYKEGKYIKEWNGKEDNEILMEIIKNGKKEDIYKELNSIYQNIKK